MTSPSVVAVPVNRSDTALHHTLYERALIDLWPHLSFADEQPLRRICDLGCGEGVMTEALSATFPKAQVLALGASARAMDKARSLSPRPQWVEAETDDWQRLLASEGPFDLIICHNGWPLGWGLADGLERLIEVTARGGQILIHLNLSLFEALEPGLGLFSDLAAAYARLGHLTTAKGLDVWRTDYAPQASVSALEGLLDAHLFNTDETRTRAPVIAALKNQMTTDGRLISRHLFIKIGL